MVVLINAPLKFTYKENYLDDSKMPLGLVYLASYLRYKNIDVKIIDAYAQNLSLSEIINQVKIYKPEFIGINCLTFNQEVVIKIVNELKLSFSNTPIIVGGVHPTLSKSKLIELNKNIDILVFGEGEITLSDLILDYKNKNEVSGIIYRDKEKLIENPKRPRIENLDILPLPALDLLPLDLYLEKEKRLSIISSRGCPYNCIFCASPVLWEKNITRRSIDNVISEIKIHIRKYNIENFQFLDDEFFNRPFGELKKLINEIKKLNIKWRAIGRIDILKILNDIDQTFIKNLADSGCYKLTFGIESGSKRIQKFMGKNIKLDLIPDIISECNKFGIETKAYFMLGFPTETYKEIQQTIDLSLELKKAGLNYAVFLPVMAYYGTTLYKYFKNNKNFSNDLLNNTELIKDFDVETTDYILKLLKRYSYIPKFSANEYFNKIEIRNIIKCAYKLFYEDKINERIHKKNILIGGIKK